MCVTIEKHKEYCFNFDHHQYEKEVEKMRKRIENIIHKVEQTKKIIK